MSRYVARKFQPGNMMFDQGVEDHCWSLFDNMMNEAVEMEGMLEHRAQERAEEWSELDRIGSRTLEVTFKRTDEKHDTGRKADTYIYDVYVEEVLIGSFYKDYEAGAVIARGCVGGSYPGGWTWNFAATDELAQAYDHEPETMWFMPSGDSWPTQREAFKAFRQALDEPLRREDCKHTWWVHRVQLFLRFLNKRMRSYATVQPQQRNIQNHLVREGDHTTACGADCHLWGPGHKISVAGDVDCAACRRTKMFNNLFPND